MDFKQEHINVCICTYKRPELLKNLLIKLQNQRTNQFFSYSIIVVDNDYERSGKVVVETIKKNGKIPIEYYVEPEQNIALARNKAIENAKGDYVAFIDDDELPIDDWLLNLYQTLNKYEVAGILGPVKPYFEGEPPEWLVRGKFCERESFKTGTNIHWDQTRTGNTLLRKYLFESEDKCFDAKLGRTGGEDIDFFKRAMDVGRNFVWCNEAVVFEVVPPERWTKHFYLRKYLQMGGLTGEIVKKWSFSLKYKWFAKAVLSISFYSLVLPFSALVGQHAFMKCLLKDVYYLSWLVGFLGRALIRFRY